MSEINEQLFLKDILEAVHRIQSYMDGVDYDQFQKDTKTQDAVLRNVEIIGEAAKQLSETVRQQAPQIPWRNIARMRDKLIHHYFGVNLDVVWHVTQNDLPALMTAVEAMLIAGETKDSQ